MQKFKEWQEHAKTLSKESLQYVVNDCKNARDAMHDNEIECLSDSKGLTCLDCGLCDGNKRTNKSIVIAVHGTRASNFKTSTLIPLVNV